MADAVTGATPDQADTDSRKIEDEIGTLTDLDLLELRKRWQHWYGSAPPVRMSRELIIRAVAYRIQEHALGGLSQAVRVRLTDSKTSEKGARQPSVRSNRIIKPGTRFVREWQGRTHEVTALPDGRFHYQGDSYKSLSVIARKITGTRWSGPSFFGLNARVRAKL